MVDPQLEIEPYLEAAAQKSMRVTHVIETHVQADHVSGARRLAAAARAPVLFHESADVHFPHVDVADGEEHEMGNVRMTFLHTPGHTPDSLSILVTDRTRGPDPWFVLTGDTLFAGGVGRPDLSGHGAERALAEQLYDSVYTKLLKLPDHLEIYPAHFGGAACGKGLSGKPGSTIGFERRFNPALQGELADFLDARLGPQPPRPPNMERIVELNRGELVGAQPPLERLGTAPEEAVVLDVRETHVFAAGHHPGAVGIPVDGSSFATRAAFVLPERPVVLHAADATVAAMETGPRLVSLELVGKNAMIVRADAERHVTL